ncbi:MAG TPA: HEPN domain-containing protein, partial [Archaeoglobus veneficus]|nr:HEPN domain-containing protein [Archaeoglobus veneficus]
MNIGLERQLLEIAKQDLEASILLHKSKLYLQAIFTLQQSVEKIAKAFALYFRIISENELKKISHNTLKIYKKTTDNLVQKIKRIESVSQAYPELKNTNFFRIIDKSNIGETGHKFEKLYHKLSSQKPLVLSEEEIDEILNKIENFQNETRASKVLISQFQISELDFQEMVEEVVSAIYELLPILNTPENAIREVRGLISRILNKDFITKLIKEVFPLMIDMFDIWYKLLYLSV